MLRRDRDAHPHAFAAGDALERVEHGREVVGANRSRRGAGDEVAKALALDAAPLSCATLTLFEEREEFSPLVLRQTAEVHR